MFFGHLTAYLDQLPLQAILAQCSTLPTDGRNEIMLIWRNLFDYRINSF
jgi:hypothetical protein